MFKKEKGKRIYGNIKDDSIYQDLGTQKSENLSEVPSLISENPSQVKPRKSKLNFIRQ